MTYERWSPRMTAITQPVETGEPIAIPAWSWAALVVALLASYVMLQENGCSCTTG